MKKISTISCLAFLALVSHSETIKGNQAAFSIGKVNANSQPYDSAVEYIGFSVISAGDAKSTNIVISDIQWDSFYVSLLVPSTSLVGYRDCTGGNYSYYACNRIAFTNTGTYRGGPSFMGIQDGVSVITDRFVEYLSPAPDRLYWTIDGIEYSVAACRNAGGDFGIINNPDAGRTMGYYVSRCKLFYKGEVKIDLIAVRFTNENGKREGGMFDILSGTLYRKNFGTGEFEIGPDL